MCIRDRARLGKKPLYYGVQGGVLLFGSELKALQAHPQYRGTIDRGALALLLRFGYVPAPWSIHVGIRKLPPGCMLRMTRPADAKNPPTPYWSVQEATLAGAQDPLALGDAPVSYTTLPLPTSALVSLSAVAL